jgi:hypothetical protein
MNLVPPPGKGIGQQQGNRDREKRHTYISMCLVGLEPMIPLLEPKTGAKFWLAHTIKMSRDSEVNTATN